MKRFLILLATILPTLAFAADITPNSKCGEVATGYKADGSRTVVTDSVPWAHVGADGVWAPCPIEPPKPPEPKGCPAVMAWKTWTVGDNTCTTQVAGTSGPDLFERTLAHGETGYWRQWTGLMRGQVIERCDDGVRRVTGKSCSVATVCDTMISDIRREGRVYAYDGRPPEKQVPLGRTVDATDPDGGTWPITCVAGDWYVPADRPKPPAPPASAAAPRVLYCGPQTVRSRLAPSLTLTYSGPRVLPGAEVDAYSIAGTAVRVVCGDNATLVPKWDLRR